MARTVKTEVVYQGADNINEVIAEYRDVATKSVQVVDWSSVTRITGSLVGSLVTFDETSLDGTELFDISKGNGLISFNFGALNIARSTFALRLQYYQGVLDTVGTQIFHEDNVHVLLQFKFVGT